MSKKCVISLFLVLIIFRSTLPGYCASHNAENIIVSCDRWPDFSSLEKFGNDCVRLGDARTHEEKAISVWRFIQQCTEDGPVPKEPANGKFYIISPIKLLNVYGVHWCDGLSRIMTMTWRSLGYRAEKLYKFGHTFADCWWEDNDGIERWHVFDLNQHWFVYDRSGSHIATKDELAFDYSLIYLPSRTPIPSRPSLMQPSYVHAGHLKIEPHNTGISLRMGESIERYWGNEGKPYYNLFRKGSKRDFEHGPYEITYGNGRSIYEPDLSKRDFEQGLFRKPVNMACTEVDGLGPALHPKEPNKKAIAIFEISLPYIISDAWLNATLIRRTPDDWISFSISVDGGVTWQPLWETAKDLGSIRLDQIGFCQPFNPSKETKPETVTPFGRYDYLIKIEINAAKRVTDCGLDSLSVVTVFQHNLFSLPMLWPGKNLITVQGDIDPKGLLRLTYVWDDAKGKGRKHVAEIGATPFHYEITTTGNKWEEVICRSITIESLSGKEDDRVSFDQERDILPSTRLPMSRVFPTNKSIGRYHPKPLKKASYYIGAIEAQLKLQRDPATDDEALRRLSKKIGQNILALSALKDPRARDVLEEVIENDRSHPCKNKIWACQALFHSVGKGAAPILIRILEKDDALTWYDPRKRWSQDAMWLHTTSMSAAILARIRNFEGRERAADLIADTIEGKRTRVDPKKLWRGREICWGLIRSLGRLGNYKHIPLLLEVLSKKDPDAIAVAVQALTEIGDPSVIPELLRLLKHAKYPPILVYIIEALGNMGTEEIAPHLYPFLSHWDEDFRGAAAVALGNIGGLKAATELKKMMYKERFPWVIAAASKSLQRFEEKGAASGKAR
ncbi:MAG: HEAT repeat domain-containing protein [Thermodesulfobacteriota bacterium]|nr:HEAT repeat domain-containing protein [Thermodesulfobacteriota bacterium]